MNFGSYLKITLMKRFNLVLTPAPRASVWFLQCCQWSYYLAWCLLGWRWCAWWFPWWFPRAGWTYWFKAGAFPSSCVIHCSYIQCWSRICWGLSSSGLIAACQSSDSAIVWYDPYLRSFHGVLILTQ